MRDVLRLRGPRAYRVGLRRDAIVHAEGSADEWWLTSLHIELADRGLEFSRLDVVGASAREALRLAR